MKHIITLSLLFVALVSHGQWHVAALPLHEIDSSISFTTHRMDFQYDIQHHYAADGLDTFDLLSNSSGPYQKSYFTWEPGTTAVPAGRDGDMRVKNRFQSQRYVSGSWQDNALDVELHFGASCMDTLNLNLLSVTGPWSDTFLGYRTTASFDAHGYPIVSHTWEYDHGSLAWYDWLHTTYSYDQSGHRISQHVRQWQTASTIVAGDYLDSNFAYSSANDCRTPYDSFVTYQMVGSAWVPTGKYKYQFYPMGGRGTLSFTYNTATSQWDSSTMFIQLYDRFGNDSITITWLWNSSMMQFRMQSHDVYQNTYDLSNNLLRQVRLSNYNTHPAYDSLVPYTIKMFSNYVSIASGSTAIEELNSKAVFKLMPNPSSGKITIALPEMPAENTMVTISDMTGRRVYEAQLRSANTEIEIDGAEGLYLVNITSSEQSTTQKLIVSK